MTYVVTIKDGEMPVVWLKPKKRKKPTYMLSGACIDYDRWTVPGGYISDGGTIPWIVWPIFHPMGEYAIATFIHDYLISEKKCDRARADLVFRDAMYEAGTSKLRRTVIFAAVRSYTFILEVLGKA